MRSHGAPVSYSTESPERSRSFRLLFASGPLLVGVRSFVGTMSPPSTVLALRASSVSSCVWDSKRVSREHSAIGNTRL